MATTGPINSTLLRIYRNTAGTTYVAVGHATDASISFSHQPREITSKDSAGWAEFLEGLRGATFSTTSFAADDAAEGFAEWLAELDGTARGSVTIQFTTNVSGDEVITMAGYIESLEKNSSGAEQTATWTCSGVMTGSPTIATVV